MKILLTGATGFIGSHIGAVLVKADFELICLRRKTSNLRRCSVYENKVTWLNSDTEGWQERIISLKPNAIIHCAWSGVTAAERDDWTLQSNNVNACSELLRIATALELKRLIALGSQAEYGSVHRRVDESWPARPTTAYGAAKLSCLTFLETLARQKHFSYAWLRLFSVYGPGESESWFIPNLIKQFREGKPPQLTGCEQRYDYLHVTDLANGVLAALRQTDQSGVFNLGSNTSVPLKQIVQTIRQFTGERCDAVFGALPYRPNQSMHIEGDSTRFCQTFEFTPKISLEDGLRELILQTIDQEKQRD